APRRSGFPCAAIVRTLTNLLCGFDQRVLFVGLATARLAPRESNGDRIEIDARRTQPAEHRLDEDGPRATKRIEHEMPGAKIDEPRGRRRMHARRVGVKSVDVRTAGPL